MEQKTDANAEGSETPTEAPSYDTAKQEEDNSLNGLLSKFSKSKDSSSFGQAAGLLNLAQKSRRVPQENNLIQLTGQESEAEAEAE